VTSHVAGREEQGKLPSRVRLLTVNVYGKPRTVGWLRSDCHTDARTLVQKLVREQTGRGRPIALSEERLQVVEQALSEGRRQHYKEADETGQDSAFAGSVAELRAMVQAWTKVEWDASAVDAYYDEWRASGYDEHCKQPQRILTLRALQLTGRRTMHCALARHDSSPGGGKVHTKPELLLDLGCGSGLSSRTCSREGFFVIGVDVSTCMLALASPTSVGDGGTLDFDRIQCDISHPLPFRAEVFDRAVSISAAHYMCEATRTQTAQQRCGTLLTSIYQSLVPGGRCALQFYPGDEVAHTDLLLRSALGSNLRACLVVDQPHHTQARRWYLHCQRALKDRRATCRGPNPCRLLDHSCAACTLSFKEWAVGSTGFEPQVEKEHELWLVEEHVRQARRLMRLSGWLRKHEQAAVSPTNAQSAIGIHRRSKRVKKKGTNMSEPQRRLAAELVERFGEAATLQDLMTSSEAVIQCLHASGGHPSASAPLPVEFYH